MPSRNKLPSLGMLTVDVRAQEEEDEDALASMETNCNEERQRLIEEGLRDEMKLRQPPFTPDLHVGIKMQYAFRYTYAEESDGFIEWCNGTVHKVSNGNNLRNTTNGSKHYKKGGAVEVKWDADASKNEDVSYSIVQIKKTLFNCYDEFGWRLFFDVPWNSIPLQMACKAKEKNNEEESTSDN